MIYKNDVKVRLINTDRHTHPTVITYTKYSLSIANRIQETDKPRNLKFDK